MKNEIPATRAMSQQQLERVKTHLGQLFEELLIHDGYADLSVEIRILKRGQKEVVIRCGKQYRYVVDFRPLAEARPASVDASQPNR